MEYYNLIALGTMAFVSANIDGMIIALAFMADPTYNNKNILYGQIIGFWALVIVSFVLAQSLFFIPKGGSAWLGFVPIIFGGVKLFNYVRRGADELVIVKPSNRQIQEITILTVATGADDVIAYTPIFLTRKPHEIAFLFIMFAIMTVAWWFAALFLSEREIMKRIGSRGARLLVPILMIGIGIVILAGD
jgi:cadmium resistance protein CadD (predicted permease)